MGPSIKFVLAIEDAFSNKKMGVNFFHQKKTKPGGGPRGVWKKTTLFPDFFSATFPNQLCLLRNIKEFWHINRVEKRKEQANPYSNLCIGWKMRIKSKSETVRSTEIIEYIIKSLVHTSSSLHLVPSVNL